MYMGGRGGGGTNKTVKAAKDWYLEHAGVGCHHIKSEDERGHNKLHRVVRTSKEIHFYESTYGISLNLTSFVSFSAN